MSSMNLGSYLKSVREEKNITVRSLAELIKFSPTYISSVENNKKKNPSQKFLEAYIYGLAETIEDIREIKKNVNSLSENKYFNDESLIDAFLQGNAPNIMNVNKGSITTDERFDFPVNDISFHLNDKYNFKYFRKIRMSDQDREYIYNFINEYFIRKLEIKKDEVSYQNQNDSINEVVAEKHLNDYNNLIKKLKNPNDLNY
ncbi:helix-turn-helix transcriptional regulator [Mammaliicoccus sciuri]|uniref:Helix-turn-helix transcriptional regulator n=1 Tax=Mammaliicoccus sciuri TaxID=1296 RepID=A0AB37HMY5_MAMSC|nr:helix-turn-helix transcriptional regulator [Mammaliicoccus sciuri]QRN92057.1 helix-turn-helix transcriptional regulator [Mammaliicoccus sciuri]